MAILAECPVCHTKQTRKNKKCIGWLEKKSGLKCNKDLDEAKKAKKVRYWIVYRMPDGKQRWESVGAFEGLDAYSVTDAEDALAKRKVQKKEKRIFDMLPESNHRFSELAEWYLGLEKVKGMAYYRTLNINLDSFSAVFGNDIVNSIKPADLENYQAKRQKEGLSKKVPISKTLCNILKKLPRGLHNDYVFLYRGKPLREIRNGLIKSCKDAGIPYGRKVKDGFTFHDLRHTTKTMMRKAGVDKNVRAVIFGHSVSGDMDFRYDHVDETDLLGAIDRTEDFIESVSQNVSQADEKLNQNQPTSL